MNSPTVHRNFPWFTISFSLFLIGVYAAMAILSESLTIRNELFPAFGAPYAIGIYHGEVWGVITNSFLHVDYIHILMNLAGLWIFGAFLERRIGWIKTAIFGLVCAAFTSLVQLASTDDAGLGFGGVNHGFFALILVLSFRNPKYKMQFLYLLSFLIIALLIFFLVENEFNNWNIGIESKLSGLLWGFFVGLCSRWKALNIKFAVLLIPFSLAALTLVYAPWSSMWQCAQGVEWHEKGATLKAQYFYQRALQCDPTNKIASENLILTKIDLLSEKAYKAHHGENYLLAHRYYLKILALDKNNKWARHNLKQLP